MTVLTVGSLFSGIGGLDLGLERAGMTVVWQSEIDSYASRVLAKHWPDVPNLGDITTINWEEVPHVDLICGGYPCQPFSISGKQRGEADPRHMWPHMRDAIRVLRPRYALLENVPGHLALGFGRVLGDLAEIGYDAEWDCIPAAAVGAPHLRWRVFVVAYPHGRRLGRTEDARGMGRLDGSHAGQARQRERARPFAEHRSEAMADTDDVGRYGRTGQIGSARWPQPQDCGQWVTEPDVGRVANGIPRRVDRLKGLGNAVVPQVAEHVGRLILENTQ